MTKTNTTFLKRNALRMRQTAKPMERLRKARELEGSANTLLKISDKERVLAYKQIINSFAKNYKLNDKNEVIDIVQRASHFNGPQAKVFMKMVEGKPLHLPGQHEDNINE